MDKEYIEYMQAKRKPINSCVELSKYFMGSHFILPVYLTPTFKREFNYIISRSKNKEKLSQKQKEFIDKIHELIKQHIRKDDFLELNEWQTRDLLDLLKEVSE